MITNTQDTQKVYNYFISLVIKLFLIAVHKLLQQQTWRLVEEMVITKLHHACVCVCVDKWSAPTCNWTHPTHLQLWF